jgi:uncharacterized protein YdeI (YjbR/CyaY-like superfamily)
MKPRFFTNALEFRRWLRGHHATASELVVGFFKKHKGSASMRYPEAVDEALAVGWIDGVRRRIDDDRYSTRFSPRRPRSRWSRINVRRVQELQAQGRMTPRGLAVFRDRNMTSDPYSYETRPRQFPEGLRRMFQKHEAAWEFFASQPPGYRRTCIWWVISARQRATQEKRLARVIACSARRKRLL